MPEERRKGPSDRRRRRGDQPREDREPSPASVADTGVGESEEQQRPPSAIDRESFSADELEQVTRSRQGEERGEVF